MKKKGMLIVCVMFCVVASTGVVSATPVKWNVNGHYYDQVTNFTGTWEAAKLDAEEQFFMGEYGHLVTLTSEDENSFFTDNVLTARGFIGAVQAKDEPDAAKSWSWVTGEDWAYQNWSPGEPNDYDKDEYCSVIYHTNVSTTNGHWNDIKNDPTFTVSNYYVEYDVSAVAPVPEPGSVFLLGAGLIGLVALRRKFTK